MLEQYPEALTPEDFVPYFPMAGLMGRQKASGD